MDESNVAAPQGVFKSLGGDALSILSHPNVFLTYLALVEGEGDALSLARRTGLTPERALVCLTSLMQAGVAEALPGRAPPVFRARHKHLADLAASPEERLQFRHAILAAVQDVIREGRRALVVDPQGAVVGASFSSVPYDEDTLTEIAKILTDAEGRIKELVRRRKLPADAPTMRVVTLMASQ